jgi:hypothetical protein
VSLGHAIRRGSRRWRRALGLPAISRRATLWLLFTFLGLAFLTATFVVDFVAMLGQYRWRQYDPKDFQREDFLKRPAVPKGGSP